MDYARNVDLYSIAVGDDACEEMLKYFSGDERFFLVSESESIADKLDFVTRQTLAHHTTVPVNTTPANIPDDVPSPDGTGNADPDGTPKPADTNIMTVPRTVSTSQNAKRTSAWNVSINARKTPYSLTAG